MQHQRRLASWGPAPEEPYRTSWERLVAFYRPAVPVFAACFLLPIVLLMLGAVPTLGAAITMFVCGLALAALVATFAAINYARNHRRPREERDWTDPLPRMAVEVRLYANNYWYGEDHGHITLVDGWLIFEGERTSFSLAPHDVTEHRRRRPTSERESVDFRLTGVDGNVRVKILAEDVHQDVALFLSVWATSQIAYPSVSVLPPLEPIPDRTQLLADPDRDTAITAYLFILIIVVYYGSSFLRMVVSEAHLSPFAGELCMPFLVVSLLSLYYGRHAWRRRAAFQALERAHCMLEANSPQTVPTDAPRPTLKLEEEQLAIERAAGHIPPPAPAHIRIGSRQEP